MYAQLIMRQLQTLHMLLVTGSPPALSDADQCVLRHGSPKPQEQACSWFQDHPSPTPCVLTSGMPFNPFTS
uniref:Secreted protein n=1 Tax=Arundo donax TaxID=35708 RepID=A0A0A9HEY4_ARUDO